MKKGYGKRKEVHRYSTAKQQTVRGFQEGSICVTEQKSLSEHKNIPPEIPEKSWLDIERILLSLNMIFNKKGMYVKPS